MPKLILCRHGQSEWNAKIYLQDGKMFNYLNKDEMKQLLLDVNKRKWH